MKKKKDICWHIVRVKARPSREKSLSMNHNIIMCVCVLDLRVSSWQHTELCVYYMCVKAKIISLGLFNINNEQENVCELFNNCFISYALMVIADILNE